MYRIIINAFNWTQDESELIDFDNCSFEEDELEVDNSCKIYRVGDEIKLTTIELKNSSNDLILNDSEERLKMGEIEYKNDRYYFVPNKKDNINNFTGEELLAWLIFKGNRFPLTKHKYKIKEGDILKLGRVWLIVRGIHIPQKKLERRNTNCLISYHSQINESLNINNDFKEYKQYEKLIDNKSDDISENQEEEEEDEEEEKKNINLKKTNENKKSPINNRNNNNYISNHNKKYRKYKEPLLIDINKNLEKLSLVPNNRKERKRRLCRICYMSEINSVSDPLIKPCKCSGSMKYIHLKCLLHWLKTKMQVDNSEYIESNFFTIYSSDKVECELCKQILPHYIRHKNKLYNLLELENNDKEKIEKKKKNNVNYTDGDNIKKNKERKDNQNKDNNDTQNYIVFDTIPIDKNAPSYIYVAKFDKEKKLKIGRGLDMNLIMNDLCISRNHCELELCENGDVLLQDNNSKFGTLVLVQAKEIEILKGQTLTIQVGRTFFNIFYKKESYSIFKCCKADVIEKKKTYENINYKAVKLSRNAIILNESFTEGSDNEEENKHSENDYENEIKKLNNKKINILKIVNNKKDSENENTNINIENILKNTKTIDNIIKNKEDFIYINGEQQNANNQKNNDDDDKKIEINY